ncbi:hypothetical protein ACFSJ3_00105 [Corallincola platygyrae]|uniref:Uncharacterized protein n=1 Tax=Corallincola platygyrae TaxID=1193278 RepID=A0ABW4XFW4_9GAMM
MKSAVIILLVGILAGIFWYKSTGPQKAGTNVFAKYQSSNAIEINGQVLTITEAIDLVNSIEAEGKRVDFYIGGNNDVHKQVEELADKVRQSPSFKGRNVIVIFESY